MKGFKKKIFLLSGLFLLGWLLLAQSCMSFRKSDADEKKEFAKDRVELRTATIKVEGRHLHYAFTGNDTLPTIFFIHGSPGSWTAFAEYMKDSLLLKKFRMVSIDRPGFGFSDYGQPQHLDVQSLWISRLFPLLANHKPMFLAGHSLGGPLVIKLAADNPQIFSGIVVISGSIDPAEENPEKWRPILFNTPLNYFVPGAMRPSNEELWYLKTDLVYLKKDFSKIPCPVYFIHGAKDTWVPPGNVDYGKKLLINSPKVEETLIPGANHFIPWTKFTEIRSVLLKLY
jgi:pimeloyl-ACP methyl ester carboxylesterase